MQEDEERWRALAQEARETAERMTDAVSKRSLLTIAERYEALAERARRIREDR